MFFFAKKKKVNCNNREQLIITTNTRSFLIIRRKSFCFKREKNLLLPREKRYAFDAFASVKFFTIRVSERPSVHEKKKTRSKTAEFAKAAISFQRCRSPRLILVAVDAKMRQYRAASIPDVYRVTKLHGATTAEDLTRTFFRHIESGLSVSGYTRGNVGSYCRFLFHLLPGLIGFDSLPLADGGGAARKGELIRPCKINSRHFR